MNFFSACFLGFLQGITEFLPVSSSGHLIAVPYIFGWEPSGMAFDAVVHLGTLGAVLVYFRKDLRNLFLSFLSKNQRTEERQILSYAIILGSVPAFVFGFFGKDLIERLLRGPVTVAVMLFLVALVLSFADRFALKRERQGKKPDTLQKITLKKGFLIGLAQAVALVPGTSRSGITASVGLFLGFSRKEALRFSFLLSIPIIMAAGLLAVGESAVTGFEGASAFHLTLGFFCAFFGGIIALYTIFAVVERWRFTPFVVYRMLLGILILLLAFYA